MPLGVRNCGTKDRKNKMTFGLEIFIMKPRATIFFRGTPLRELPFSSAVSPAPEMSSRYAPHASHKRYAAPARRTKLKSISLSEIIIEIPAAQRKVCTGMPATSPHVISTPRRQPFDKLSVSTKTMSGPGAKTSAMQATA